VCACGLVAVARRTWADGLGFEIGGGGRGEERAGGQFFFSR
jgi:hypothetical protein